MQRCRLDRTDFLTGLCRERRALFPKLNCLLETSRPSESQDGVCHAKMVLGQRAMVVAKRLTTPCAVRNEPKWLPSDRVGHVGEVDLVFCARHRSKCPNFSRFSKTICRKRKSVDVTCFPEATHRWHGLSTSQLRCALLQLKHAE